MEHALAENEQSETFDDDAERAAARYEDDTGGRLGPVRARAGPAAVDAECDAGSSRDERFWRDLVPTGLSWNRSGYSIAVSYGRFDVTGWCDSPGALCVWNLRREDVDPRKPDSIFETDSCLQCVAWHPVDPAVVAAGSFDGEVHVWDVRGDADGDGDGDGKENVLGKRSNADSSRRSAVSDASHRGPWFPSRGSGARAPQGRARATARRGRTTCARSGRTDASGLGLFQSRDYTRRRGGPSDDQRIRLVAAFRSRRSGTRRVRRRTPVANAASFAESPRVFHPDRARVRRSFQR